MTEALLADGTKPSTDATTTPGEGASADAPTKPDEQKVDDKTTDTTTVDTTESEPEPAEPAPKAPENYEFAVPDGLPEGYELDDVVTGKIAEVAKTLDLTQEQAQSLVSEVLPVMHRRTEEQQTALNAEWVSQTKADQEIGGQKLDENLIVAKRAVQAYGSDGLQELLNGPIGSHPEVVRFLVKIGATVSEDQFVGGEHQKGEVDLDDTAAVAKRLYPKSPQPT